MGRKNELGGKNRKEYGEENKNGEGRNWEERRKGSVCGYGRMGNVGRGKMGRKK